MFFEAIKDWQNQQQQNSKQHISTVVNFRDLISYIEMKSHYFTKREGSYFLFFYF